jgi:hypothetical protein
MSGSWNIDRAVQSRWTEKGLDAKFRAFWRDPSETKWPVLGTGEARPQAQMPYCVFEKTVPLKTAESTATPGEGGYAIEYWTIPISFRIHAARRSTPARSAKDIAAAMAKEVVLAFEDDAGVLDIDDGDCHLETVVGPDFDTREDDDVHVWVVQFEVHVERRRALRGV